MENQPNIQKFYVLRKITAFIIDIFLSFFVIGGTIAYLTGDLTSGGFSLDGGPALLAIALVITYFIVGNKYLGGTIGKRIVRL